MMASKNAIILGLCVVLLGCHNLNVKVGDKDYPKANPSPSHMFTFRGTIDSKLHIQFKTLWYATNNDCYYMTSYVEGASNNYGASSPLNYILSDNHFEVSIATDGVLPGRCGWKFSGISAIRTDIQNTQLTPVATYVIATNSPPLEFGKSPNGTINYNCHPKSKYAGCFPQNVGDNVLWWYPETTEMEANFYY